MLKPIEAGCLAVIVKSHAGNEGMMVTVEKYIGVMVGYRGDDRWEIKETIRAARVGNHTKAIRGYMDVNSVQGKHLMRIDGGTFKAEQEEQSKELVK